MSRRLPRTLFATCLALLAAAAAARAAVPLPEVSGPLRATAGSYPFGAADHQRRPQRLGRVGYVEEEYLVRGRANVYDWPDAGGAVVRTADAPYATRVLVRRPARTRRASGTVWVEMLNPSNMFDLNIGWALTHREYVRRGDAWVGITAKPVALQALKTFDPRRYGSLSFANPLPAGDPRNCPVTGDSTQATENGLVWDVNSQVAAWIRSRAPSNPFRRAGRALRVYGFGYSQTGGYLATYVGALHRRVTRENGGRPLFDAYLIGAAGGAFTGLVPINQCAAVPPLGDPRFEIRDLGVPVIRAMTQSDYLAGIAARRADGDRRDDRYRHYELAGAAHATPDELYYAAAPADIARAGRTVPSLMCDEGPRSRFPSSALFDALARHLDRWVRRGIAPPPGRTIRVRDGAAVLDRFGNVVGGVRSPDVDVPISTWSGTTTGPGFCGIAGAEHRFSAARLRALYPTHGTYVRAVGRDARRLQHSRYLTAAGALRLVGAARRARVP
ncbi:MAG TPA: alpha/beta hydrolase domain-containing protein [Solirubrobacteraceae bacterium]|nr:alpha/beta hydrolase domain-containing protein [Solirubrobacteraceae bacterium]